MKVVVLSYGILGHDGRLKELIKVADKIGKTTVLACSLEKSKEFPHAFLIKNRASRNSLLTYARYIYHCIREIRRNPRIDILIVDDYLATIAGMIASKLFRPTILVQDSREMYVGMEMPRMGNLFLYFERKLYKKSDLIICANSQRAKIMSEVYNLDPEPYAFENIRILDGEYNEEILNEKYENDFKMELKLISTGGISIDRGTDRLVRAMEKFPNYSLHIIGKGAKKDFDKINQLISKKKLRNVYIYDRVPLGELLYLIRKCDIGIVEYHKNNLNNLYCASGKVYEYMAEGLPLVTTENIPLKELCNEHKVGVSDDNFINGIIRVAQNIEYYRGNVNKFMENISVDQNNQNLANEILKTLEKINEKKSWEIQ